MINKFLKLIYGGGATQVAQALSLPILAKLYGPAAIGHYAVLSALAIIAQPVASLRLENIVLIEKSKNAKLIVSLFRTTNAAISFACTILIFFINHLGGWIELNKTDGVFIFLILFLSNSVQFYTSHLIKNENISTVNKGLYLRSSLSILTPIVIYFLGIANEKTLVLVMIFALLAQASVYKSKIQKSPMNTRTDYLKTKALIKKYRKNIFHGSLQGFFNGIAHNLPTILVDIFFGKGAAGVFSLSDKIFRLPISTIHNSARQLLLINLTKISTRHFFFIQLGLAITGISGAGFIFLISDKLEIILGSRWLGIGATINSMSIWGFGFFLNLIGSVFITFKQDYANLLIVQIFDVSIKIIIFWYYSQINLPFQTVTLYYSIASLLFNFYVVYRGWKLYLMDKN